MPNSTVICSGSQSVSVKPLGWGWRGRWGGVWWIASSERHFSSDSAGWWEHGVETDWVQVNRFNGLACLKGDLRGTFRNQPLASLASRGETILWLRLIGGQFGCPNRNKQKRLKGLCSGKGLRVCLIMRSLHGTPGKQKYWTKRLNAVLSKGRSAGIGRGTFGVVVLFVF